MGPFEKKVDNGLENRKLAYELLLALLAEYKHLIEINEFLNVCISGLDDSSIEIQLICQQLVTKILHIDSSIVKQQAKIMVGALKKSTFRKTKETATKQEIDDSQELIKSSLSLIVLINQLQVLDTEWTMLISDIMKVRDEQHQIVGINIDHYFPNMK